MTGNGHKQVGLSQRIQLDWLAYAAGLALAGKTREQVEDSLQELLRDKVSVGGSAQRGNREKIITILVRIWIAGAERTDPLRREGLALLKGLPESDRLAVHWCMTLAEYPFWGTVAETVGRLLRLQETITAMQVQRRIRESLGERETVARAARRILRSFIDWKVLVETARKGSYVANRPVRVTNAPLVKWMIEALLCGRASEWVPLESLQSHPSLFPFAIAGVSSALFGANERVEVMRHGVNQEMVRLTTIARRVQDDPMSATLAQAGAIKRKA